MSRLIIHPDELSFSLQPHAVDDTSDRERATGIVKWLKRRIHSRDRKVSGSSPDRSGVRIFSPGSAFSVDCSNSGRG